MAVKSAKQANIQTLNLVLNGGLNYASSPANIADNELKRASNFIYDPATDYLMTRPGTDCITAATCDGTHPILAGYYYEKTASVAFHVAACNGKLYYLDVDHWHEIGALNDTTTVPAFLQFNNVLLIADGSNIKSWDGAAAYSNIADSPKANALATIKSRVVCNATDEPDSVYLSAPEDATSGTAWDTTSGGALGLRAGFGDMLAVNSFAVLGQDLIVSKIGKREKMMYRVNVSAADETTWYCQELSASNAAQNAQSMISAYNNIFFVDNNGFKSVEGTDTYGDLAIDSIGRKINTLFIPGYTCNCLTYLPTYNAIWFNTGDRIFSYTERHDPQSGSNLPAFTDMSFMWGRPTSFYQAGDDVYITGFNGYLYKLDDTLDTDEVTPAVTQNYVAAVRSKTFTFFVDGVLRKLQYYLSPKSSGGGNIFVCTAENEKVAVTTFTTLPEGQYLNDATEYLNDATGYLYDTGASPWITTSRNRVRSDEMAFELELTSGRCGVEWCKAEIALVEGGG
jgi:hypothetical protein